MPQTVSLDPLSYTSVPIKLKTITDAVIASATGFFYKYKNKTYLITNWHNVTGIHPVTKQRIDVTSPVTMNIALLQADNNGISWKWGILNLYNTTKQPEWFIHPLLKEQVDVVALEIELDVSMSADFKHINDISFEDIKPQVADQVFILGFPNNLNSGGQFPLWKSGSIASEPDIDIDNLPKFYVDAATRQGMSGSPVVVRRIGVHGAKDGVFSDNSTIGEAQVFCGIYSGRIHAADLLEAQIGIVWKASVIDEIIKGNTKDTLYYPEESFPAI